VERAFFIEFEPQTFISHSNSNILKDGHRKAPKYFQEAGDSAASLLLIAMEHSKFSV